MSQDNTDTESETVYCTSCGDKISADTNFCPKCGADQSSGGTEGTNTGAENPNTEQSKLTHRLPGISSKNSTRRNVLIGAGYSVLGVGVLGAVAGSGDEGSGGGDNSVSDGGDSGSSDAGEEQYPNAWAYDEDTGIVLRNVEGNIGEFSSEVRGEATNESDTDYSYVQVSFAFYDSTGAKVGDALANTSGLDAGQRWVFEAVGTATENVDSAGLEDVTAY